ncbi:MAG TPA: RsmD family RNA methyltransferase [Candidatus Sulfotelmatobacter sp.]|jgi:trimethylguanosine synthase|nr:RsmD family RNA methyltransferase [Candidatus Sulfotelmatobacter sp.]
MIQLSKSDICPFGKSLQKYWNRRSEYFSDGILIDAEGLYSVVPEQVGLRLAELIQGKTILDGFADVGGTAIAFARVGKQVIAVDTDNQRLTMAEHNADIYTVTNEITFIHGDFFKVASTVKADTVYLDPPWSGPNYKEHGRFLFEHFNPDGNRVLEFSFHHFNEVVLRVPTIFDMSELKRFNTSFTVHDDVSEGRVVSKTIILQKNRPNILDSTH